MTKINDAIRTIILADITANKISQDKKFKIQTEKEFSKEDQRKLYDARKSKKKKLFKVYASDYKKTMFKEHKWVATFYVISIILLFAIIISSIMCLLLINDTFDKYFAVGMILFFGFCFQCLPYITYRFCLRSQAYGDFHTLVNEKILLTDDGFNYYYSDELFDYVEKVSMFKFCINYKDLKYVEYDKRVGELFFYGNIPIYQYKNGNWSLLKFEKEEDNTTPTGVLIQNIYDIDLIDLIKNNNVVIEDYNYLGRRNKEKQTKESV